MVCVVYVSVVGEAVVRIMLGSLSFLRVLRRFSAGMSVVVLLRVMLWCSVGISVDVGVFVVIISVELVVY